MPIKTRFTRYAQLVLEVVENLGLMVIAIATVVAGWQEVMTMIGNARVTLADLLLMFLYLEVLAMVGLYFNSGKLPVRFPLYIAMVALARYVILDVKELDVWHIMGCTSHSLWARAFSVQRRRKSSDQSSSEFWQGMRPSVEHAVRVNLKF